ncbi:hypothetical protein ACGF12_01755, partial [Kitasatospora sp. NPDC048296]|uniref:hypothetical protein n=1 Tax=Kitasatospora sp. NPDC048296 TaxID=3364048 RepID=UPI0037198428
AGMSRTAAIGAVVANFCMAASPSPAAGPLSARRFRQRKSYVAFAHLATSALRQNAITAGGCGEIVAVGVNRMQQPPPRPLQWM